MNIDNNKKEITVKLNNEEFLRNIFCNHGTDDNMIPSKITDSRDYLKRRAEAKAEIITATLTLNALKKFTGLFVVN